MSDNFRQAVEKILQPAVNAMYCDGCDDERTDLQPAIKVLTDRICAEVEKLAEGMSKPDPSRFINGAFRHGFEVGCDWTLRDNQAFIRKQLQ